MHTIPDNAELSRQDAPMHFFSVEWLEEGQISVERPDGIILVGTPDKVFALLKPMN